MRQGGYLFFSLSCAEEFIIKKNICKITSSPLWLVTRNACSLCFAKPFCFIKYKKLGYMSYMFFIVWRAHPVYAKHKLKLDLFAYCFVISQMR
jgi:hypothetical protein